MKDGRKNSLSDPKTYIEGNQKRNIWKMDGRIT